MHTRALITLAALALLTTACTTTGRDRHGPTAQVVDIERFLPSTAAKGPIPLAAETWHDALAFIENGDPATIVFPRRDFIISDVNGLSVPANCTVVMYGARLFVDERAATDGQVFVVHDAQNVSFLGGEIIGSRNSWDPGTNIAGIRVDGASHNFHVLDTTFRDLSSNAVGVFGTPEQSIHGVTVENVTATNCCNYYGDYLQSDSGPAPGSDRTDQGAVAFYHVTDWLVRGCCFEQSQSDGTHFYQSRHGQFENNHVIQSRMGGYFLEGCEYVIASGNLMSENGSRGVTIERDSRHCTLTNNVVELSGREGLWAPDVETVVVSNNIFRQNGRKDDAQRDAEIRIDDTDKFATQTIGIFIRRNLFQTDPHQTAVIYAPEPITGLVVQDNAYQGPATPIHTAAINP